MGSKSKRDYLKAIRERYRKASREEKSVILNEFCQMCGYNRKYAIRILNRRSKPGKLLRNVIKIRPDKAGIQKPGFIEADKVVPPSWWCTSSLNLWINMLQAFPVNRININRG